MRFTVKDVMTTQVVSVNGNTPFKDVAEVLIAHGVSAVPVVDDGNHVIGVVSEADLVRKEEYREQYCGEDYRPPLRARLRHRIAQEGESLRQKAGGDTAADLMTAPAVTIASCSSGVTAARLMDEHDVKRLIVVDAGGELEGILSRRDLLKVFLLEDAEIRRRLLGDLPAHVRWNDREGILIDVRQGIVTLSGCTGRRSQATAAVRTAENAAGVVAVRNEVTWREDDVLTLPMV